MTRQIINVGTADKGNGDPIRTAFIKANANFAELYNILSNNTGGSIITTDVIGSVFADDSTLLVDGINGSIPYSVLSGTPTIPAAQVQSNWTAASGMGVILNKPTLFSGSYTDLTSKPTIPTLVSQLANDSGFLTSVSNISNIRSEGNVNIDINLSDSTLRRWRFGEDGNLTFPDNTNQTTAWTGSVSSLVNGSKTVSLGSNGTLTLPSQPNLLTNVNQIFTTKIYKDAKTPTPTPAEITTAYDYWLGEQEFYNAIRNEDASGIAPTTRSWAGLPPWEAYPLIVGFTGPGLPPPNSLATAAQSAINAYLSWKELVSNLEIVNGNQTISFENTGNLILPSTVSMNGKLSLGPTLGGIHANQSTGIISIGDYIDADTGYGLAPSTTIAIGGAANVFQISTYGPPAKTWTFGKDGNLQIPGNLQISGDIRSEGNINIDINLSDSTLRRWQFGEDGDTVFPNNVSINYSGNNVQFPRIIADSGKAFSIQGQGNSGSTALAWTVDPNAASQYAAVSVSRAGGDNLAKVVLQAQSNSGDAGTAKTWKFNETGTLTLPAGSVIADAASYIKLTPAGGANEYQALLIYPTAGDGNHIHLAAPYGGTTELYLGNDLHYVKLASDGNVRIQADNGVNGAAWTFGTDGDLTIPGDIRSEGNINIDINLSDSTLRRWQFGEDGILTLPSVGKISNGAYDWTFGTDGKLTAPGNLQVNGGKIILNTGGNAYVESVDYGVNSADSAVNIFGGPYQKIKLRAGFGTQATWTFDTTGTLTFPDNTVQTTAARPFSFSVAADDSTQRAISNNESIKFTGAGGVTTASDAEGNITITGSKVIGEWLVTNGTSTYSFTLPSDGTYVMWVKGNIANGIITWNATASVTNTNVPAIGSQYAWNYTGGGSPILLTAIPDQIRGSAGTISTDATYAGTTSNRFDFGISNTSGANQTVYYGYTKIS